MDKIKIKEKLLQGIDRRLSALSGKKPLPYRLHDGHWIRDLITFKAYLLNQGDLGKLVNNLPK